MLSRPQGYGVVGWRPVLAVGVVRAVRMHGAVYYGLVAVISRVEFAGPVVTLLVTAAVVAGPGYAIR